VESAVANANPYAIPILGLALDQSEKTGSRRGNNGVHSCSCVGRGCKLFQELVGQDFGYRPNGTDAEQLAAIKKARAWWDAEGKAKYSFDYIEREVVPANAPPSPPEE
jgi:hypothetical protein